jgi:hypothetical protein
VMQMRVRKNARGDANLIPVNGTQVVKSGKGPLRA